MTQDNGYHDDDYGAGAPDHHQHPHNPQGYQGRPPMGHQPGMAPRGQQPMGGGYPPQGMAPRAPMGGMGHGGYQQGMAPRGQHPMGGYGQQHTGYQQPMMGGGYPPQGMAPRAPMGGMAPRAPMGGMGQGMMGRGFAPQQRRGDISWTAMGPGAQQRSAEIAQQREAARAERRERGYWPSTFYLRAEPGQTGSDHIGDVVILDATPGPRFHLHTLRNPRTGLMDVYEPCAKEHENCPLCPPQGQNESHWVMLLTVLNLKGYFKRSINQQVHPTKELLIIREDQHRDFDALFQTYGTLRGLQLTMVRDGQRSPRIGHIDRANPPQQHDDAAIEAYLANTGKLQPLVSNRDGRVLEPDPRHMMFPFDYARFLHRPEAARLRQLYGGAAPFGARDYGGADQGQWGHQSGYDSQSSGYTPHSAMPPAPQDGYGQGGYGQGGYDQGGEDHFPSGYGGDDGEWDRGGPEDGAPPADSAPADQDAPPQDAPPQPGKSIGAGPKLDDEIPFAPETRG